MTEILYLAWNRLEFTRASFDALLTNTDWSFVDRLVVYDDGSTDGTRDYLHAACEQAPAPTTFRAAKFRSPVETMLDYLKRTDADLFVKIDNDIALPPGWLEPTLAVMALYPSLDLLGLAAGWTGKPAPEGHLPSRYSYQDSSHIGGVGAMRTSAFERFPHLWPNGRQGFTQWQHKFPVKTGWITPDVSAVQLDLIPEEPWLSLTDYYRAKKWAREWPPYAAESREWWDWIEKVDDDGIVPIETEWTSAP